MEAVASYNEVLPGVVLKQFSKDLYKVEQKVENTVRSILSRNKALQAIRAFSRKASGIVVETNVEQTIETVVPQVEQPVVEQVAPSPVVEQTVEIPQVVEVPTVDVTAQLPSVAGARSVSAASPIHLLIKKGENKVDMNVSSTKEQVVNNVEPLPVQTPELEPVPQVIDNPNVEPVQSSGLNLATLPFPEYVDSVEDTKEVVQATPFGPSPLPFPDHTDMVMETSQTTSLPFPELDNAMEISKSTPLPFPEYVEDVPEVEDKKEASFTSTELPFPEYTEVAEVEVEQTKSNELEVKEEVANPLEAIEGLQSLVSENKSLKEENSMLVEKNESLEEDLTTVKAEVDAVKEELNANKLEATEAKEELNKANAQIIEFGEAAKSLKTENDQLRQQLNEMTNAINEALGGYQKSA